MERGKKEEYNTSIHGSHEAKNNNNIKFPSALTQAVWLYITICYKYFFLNLWVLKLSSLIFKYNTYEKWFWVVLLTANTTYRCVIEWQSHDYYYYWQVHFLVLPNWEKKVITVTKTQSAVLRHTLTTINNSNINKTHSEITQHEAECVFKHVITHVWKSPTWAVLSHIQVHSASLDCSTLTQGCNVQ